MFVLSFVFVNAKAAPTVAKPAEPLNLPKTIEELNSPDVQTRRTAIVEFSHSLADAAKLKDYNDEILPILLKATSDSDDIVRANGFGALNLVSHVTVWSRLNRSGQIISNSATVPIHLIDEPRLKDIVINHLDDPNMEVRQFAVNTLGLGYPPSAENEALLLKRWKAESARTPADPHEAVNINVVRLAIAEGLRAGQYRSSDTVNAFTQMLDDKNGGLRGLAAVFLSEAKITAVLPKIMSNTTTGETFARQASIQALGNYGSAAQSYVSELEEMAASSKEPFIRDSLNAAIKKIKASSKSQ